MGHRALTDENAGYLAQLTAGSPVLTGFHREPTFRDIRSPIGNTCRASSYNAPTKPSGPATRMLDFKRVLRRPIETAGAKRTFRPGKNHEIEGPLSAEAV
jgi:hypothetical protein